MEPSGSCPPRGGGPLTAVEVVAYDPTWPDRFEAERTALDALGLFSAIEHVGSTSVPGLVAKPTIDIMAVAEDLDAVLVGGVPGYEYRPASFPDDPRHLFFRKMQAGVRLVHLHVLHSSSPEVEGYRLFRDWLRAEPDAAARYAAIKRELADRFADDRQAYVDVKEREVDVLMDEARRWRVSRPRRVPGR